MFSSSSKSLCHSLLTSVCSEIIAERQVTNDKLMMSALLLTSRTYVSAEDFWEKLRIRYQFFHQDLAVSSPVNSVLKF